MIVLQRNAPEQLLFYDTVLRRTNIEGKALEELRTKYMQIRTGYAGERFVDREWKEVNIPGFIFHDFSCVNEFGNTHQIDTIFVCKHFVLVIEVKNISGRIDFDDEKSQFLRTREDGVQDSFRNPVEQVKRHRELLVREFLNLHEYVPVEAAIVIANPNTIIGHISPEIPIFNVSGLRSKIASLVNKHENVTLNMTNVRNYLETLHRPIHYNGFRKVQVPLRIGVICESCRTAMSHSPKGFVCVNCGWRDRNGVALRAALVDYRILYGEWLSNKQFRKFVGINSSDTAYGILKKLQLEQRGSNRGRVYLIPKRF